MHYQPKFHVVLYQPEIPYNTGSVGRYLTVELVRKLIPRAGFPYGTLAVNVVGCFLIHCSIESI